MKKQLLAIPLVAFVYSGQTGACERILLDGQPNKYFTVVEGLAVSFYDTDIYGYMPLNAEKTLRENMQALVNYQDQSVNCAKVVASIRECINNFEGSQEDQLLTALMLSHVDFRQLITQLWGLLNNLAMTLEANKARLALTKNSPKAVERALAELSTEPFEKLLLQAQRSFETNAAQHFMQHSERIPARLGAGLEFMKRIKSLTEIFDFVDACERNLFALFTKYVAKKTHLDVLNHVLYHTDAILHGASARQRADERKEQYDASVNFAQSSFGNNPYFKMAHLFSFDAETPEAQALLPKFYEACAHSSINTISRAPGNTAATTLQSLTDEQNSCQKGFDAYRGLLQIKVPLLMEKLEHVRFAFTQRGAPGVPHTLIDFHESMHYFSQTSPLEAFSAIVDAVKEIIVGAKFALAPDTFEDCVDYKPDFRHYALSAERIQLLIKGLQAQWQAFVTR